MSPAADRLGPSIGASVLCFMIMHDARTISPVGIDERQQRAVTSFGKGHKRVEPTQPGGLHRNTLGEWSQAWLQKRRPCTKSERSRSPSRGSGRRLMDHEAAAIKRIVTGSPSPKLAFRSCFLSDTCSN
jgi:hypothetical protein